MKAFEVLLNGKRLYVAGIGNDGVLSAVVDWLGRPGEDNYFLHVGGIDNTTNEHVDWKVPTIGVGDEITVRIVEAAAVDPPTKRKPVVVCEENTQGESSSQSEM